jgi:hypothetical protein
MYLGWIFIRPRPLMFCTRQLTYCSEGWDVQPCHVHLIKDLNISNVNSNECPKPHFSEESGLYNFKDVYPVYQTFHIQPVTGKCNVVEDCFFMSIKFQTNHEGRLFTDLNRKNTKQSRVQKDRNQLIQSNIIRTVPSEFKIQYTLLVPC